MKQLKFVIAITVLMLSACGDKSEKEPTVAPISPPLIENNTPVIPDPSMASPTEDNESESESESEMTLPAPTVAPPTPPEETGNLPKTNDSMKDELVSHNKTPNLKQSSPIVTEQPMLTPTNKKVSEKTALESVAPTPAKTKMPHAASNGVAGKALSHEAGLMLAKQNGCLACHKIETKLVGPAWRDVSNRYKDDPDAKTRLIAKVKTGGKGNWTKVTGGIPMPPNSPRVSDEDIEKLVTFVLSL